MSETTARQRLEAAERQYAETFEKHLDNGVEFTSRNVYIDPEVEIAPGAVILPGCILKGNTKIAAGCVIGPNTLLENTTVGAGSTVNASQCYDSCLGENNRIGPFTHVRPGTVTEEGVHLGAYVETKNANFAEGNTVSHLTYIGDADVGKYSATSAAAPSPATTTARANSAPPSATMPSSAATPTWWRRSRWETTPTPLPVPPSARMCRRGALGIERAKQAAIPGWGEKKLEKYIAKKQKLEAEKKG